MDQETESVGTWLRAMRTRSIARSESTIAQPPHANPVDESELQAMEALVRGRNTKKRKRVEIVRQRRSVGNTLIPKMPTIKRRRSRKTQSDRVVEARKIRMRGSVTAAESGSGHEDNDPLGKGAPSVRTSHDKITQQSEGGTPTIGILSTDSPGSCPMTAKMRWKNRARTMIKGSQTDLSPSIAELLQISPSANDRMNSPEPSRLLRERRQHKQILKKRNSNIAATKSTLKEAKEQHRKAKARLRLRGQQNAILKRLKDFLQTACGHDDNVPEARDLRFIMTEDNREAFVQKMVECCRNNADLRSSFLDSVKVLAKSGVMHSAALSLSQEYPCEETEEVIKFWEEFKLQKPTAKGLPMDLLKAVVKLHEERKDLSGKFTRFEDVGSCALHHISNGTWQIRL